MYLELKIFIHQVDINLCKYSQAVKRYGPVQNAQCEKVVKSKLTVKKWL